MTAYLEELTEQELEEDSGRNTWTAFWASLVEAGRSQACSDRRGRDETGDPWSTTSQEIHFVHVRQMS